MLRSLTAGLPSYADIHFRPGLNLLVTGPSSESESGPSPEAAAGPLEGEGHAGPGLAELLHFLLGASGVPRALARDEALREAAFGLEADWPSVGTVTVRRSGADAGHVYVDPDPAHDPRDPESAGALFSVGTEAVLSPEEWNARVERGLFGITENAHGVSGRTLLSYVMRRAHSKAFDESARVSPQQPQSEAAAHLAHLLGLDGQLAGELHALALREQTGKQARKAAEDPVLRRLLGDTAELRGRIQRAEAEAGRLREQIAGFHVGPAFETLRERADELNRRLRTLPDEEVTDRRTLHDLERALRERDRAAEGADDSPGTPATPGTPGASGVDGAVGATGETPDAAADAAVFAVYEQAGIVFGTQVRRDFEDVRAFHRSLTRNRRHHLQSELDEVRARIEERAEERARVADELAAVLSELTDAGALESVTSARRALAGREALVETLRHRYEAARALESSARRLRAERARLLETAAADLDERGEDLAEAARLFTTYAHRLPGPEGDPEAGTQGGAEGAAEGAAGARLTVEAGTTELHITPHLPGSPPALVTLCLDLTLTVQAHRHRRGPGFLVHDAHLLAALEPPHLAAALALAGEVCEDEGIQYVAVLHPDALDGARGEGHDPQPYVVGHWAAS